MFEKYLTPFKDDINFLVSNFDFIVPKNERRCMSDTEMFFIYANIMHLKPQIIFESGVWKGRSTAILAQCALRLNAKLWCARYYKENTDAAKHAKQCLDKLADKYNFLRILDEPGQIAINHLHELNTATPLVIVCDGPKTSQPAGIQMLRKSYSYKGLLCYFQHDVVDQKYKVPFRRIFREVYATDFDMGFLSLDFIKQYNELCGNQTDAERLGFLLRKSVNPLRKIPNDGLL